MRLCSSVSRLALLLLASMAGRCAADAPIVIAGAGLHGASLAYYLTKRGIKPLVVEAHSVAAAASGKGGGFLARDWGSGPTTQLHKVSFKLHEELARTLGIDSYRKSACASLDPGTHPCLARAADDRQAVSLKRDSCAQSSSATSI